MTESEAGVQLYTNSTANMSGPMLCTPVPAPSSLDKAVYPRSNTG